MKDSQWGALGFLTTERKPPAPESTVDSDADDGIRKFNPLIKLSAVERENVEHVNSQFGKAGNIFDTGIPLRVWPGRHRKAVHLKRMTNSHIQNTIQKIRRGEIPNLPSGSRSARRWVELLSEELMKRGATRR